MNADLDPVTSETAMGEEVREAGEGWSLYEQCTFVFAVFYGFGMGNGLGSWDGVLSFF